MFLGLQWGQAEEASEDDSLEISKDRMSLHFNPDNRDRNPKYEKWSLLRRRSPLLRPDAHQTSQTQSH